MFNNNLTHTSYNKDCFMTLLLSPATGHSFIVQHNAGEILEKTINATVKEYQADDHIICDNSLLDAISFAKKIFTTANISQPTYVDIHPDGQIALMWHISQCGIAGFFFNGQNEMIYSYYFINQEKKSDTIFINDFIESDIHKMIQESF